MEKLRSMPVGYEGSGERGKASNQEALKKAQAKIQDLARRAEAGENVDQEVKIQASYIDKLRKDAGLIENAH